MFVGALKIFDPVVSIVRNIPLPSLNELVLDFGSLSVDQEAAFIATLINMR